MEPKLSLEQAKQVVAEKAAPRVTEDSIKAKIAAAQYVQPAGTVLTLCILTMRNGFNFVGKAAPAAPENFDAEVGKRYAYEDAFKQVWTHEGYLLREILHTVETS